MISIIEIYRVLVTIIGLSILCQCIREDNSHTDEQGREKTVTLKRIFWWHPFDISTGGGDLGNWTICSGRYDSRAV